MTNKRAKNVTTAITWIMLAMGSLSVYSTAQIAPAFGSGDRTGAMDKPQSVKVGPYHYAVMWLDRVPDGPKHEGRLGATLFDRLLIQVDRTLPVEQQREVLWHEVKHACIHLQSRHFARYKNEDEWIEVMAPCEIGVLKDNPEVLQFLTHP